MVSNEDLFKAINIRCSRRAFTYKYLNDEICNEIIKIIDEINKIDNLNFQFIKDGKKALSSLSASKGMISGLPSYIAITAPDTQKGREKAGYYGELALLQLVNGGLGTCWVGGSFSKKQAEKEVKIRHGEKLYALIAVGYSPKEKTAKEKIIYNATHKNNKPYQRMFINCDNELPEFLVTAMKCVEKAPSAVNVRPCKFTYENEILSIMVENPYSEKSIDLGIAKLHIEIGARSHGVIGKWNMQNEFIINKGVNEND